jgi:hypothetical protein
MQLVKRAQILELVDLEDANMPENIDRPTKVCPRVYADAYLLSGWTIKQEFRTSGEDLPVEYLLEWPLDSDPPTIIHPADTESERDGGTSPSIAESTQSLSGAVADMEASWAQWSSGLQSLDARTTTLLKAAFEAGWEGGKSSLI